MGTPLFFLSFPTLYPLTRFINLIKNIYHSYLRLVPTNHISIMRFVSFVLLALAWSRALSVQGAPAVDQETSLVRRSGNYQELETRRDVSLERRDALISL